MKEGWYCAKCNVKMKLGVVPKYEYEEGIPLHNVQAYLCTKCDNFIFTEGQVDEMEARTEELKVKKIKRNYLGALKGIGPWIKEEDRPYNHGDD